MARRKTQVSGEGELALARYIVRLDREPVIGPGQERDVALAAVEAEIDAMGSDELIAEARRLRATVMG